MSNRKRASRLESVGNGMRALFPSPPTFPSRRFSRMTHRPRKRHRPGTFSISRFPRPTEFPGVTGLPPPPTRHSQLESRHRLRDCNATLQQRANWMPKSTFRPWLRQPVVFFWVARAFFFLEVPRTALGWSQTSTPPTSPDSYMTLISIGTSVHSVW